MLKWGVRERYLECKPLPEIQKLKEVQWIGQRPTKEIINAVFAELDERVIPLFAFIRETGCRREEALSLKHTQINLSSNPPAVVFLDNTKNGKNRQVPLTKGAINAISAMPKKSKYVFIIRNLQPDEIRPTRYGSLHVMQPVTHGFVFMTFAMHFVSEVMGHHLVDYTRKQYARFSPESASRAVIGVLEDGRISANLPLSAA